MIGTAYTILDEANDTYLAGGSPRALIWERTSNVLSSRLYSSEKAARKIMTRLTKQVAKQGWSDFTKGYANVPANEPSLVVVHITEPKLETV